MSQWRVDRKVPINVYDGDKPVCQCQSAGYAQMIVNAVNKHMRAAEVARPSQIREDEAVNDLS